MSIISSVYLMISAASAASLDVDALATSMSMTLLTSYESSLTDDDGNDVPVTWVALDDGTSTHTALLAHEETCTAGTAGCLSGIPMLTRARITPDLSADDTIPA